MASERAALSKKLRFEVFKRDKFTCQYCGAKAPDVVLHVDHVHPVFEGGDNDILNLLTACVGCNAGKGKRKLDDNAVLEKQRAQLEELSERREQLEMMLQWREGLGDLRQAEIDAVAAAFAALSDGYELNEVGRRDADKWIEEFGLRDTLDALETAFRQYGEMAPTAGGATRYTLESVSLAFSKVGGIIRTRRAGVDKPYLRTLFYVRGILRNRLNNVNEIQCMGLLERAHLAGMVLEDMKVAAKTARSWSSFRQELETFIEYMESDDA